MGRLKNFLIQEQMRLEGNYRERDHYEYLAWRNDLIEKQEHQYYEQERQRIRSLSHEQKNKK